MQAERAVPGKNHHIGSHAGLAPLNLSSCEGEREAEVAGMLGLKGHLCQNAAGASGKAWQIVQTRISGIYDLTSPDGHQQRVNIPTGTASTSPKRQAVSPPTTSQKHCHGKCLSDDQTLDESITCHTLSKPQCLPWGGSSY